ncbi:MAG: magnesium-translocating P-type ATPase [Methylobacter sp.]|nr:magnesium-translocating P-type ATPase [Methylobacter sp.]
MKLEILKEMLGGRLVKKHFTRHFRRLAIMGQFYDLPAGGGIPQGLSKLLTEAALKTPEALLAQLNSHLNGLAELEASAIRERVGFNEVDHDKPRPWWVHLWHCYSNPFSLLLTVLALISYFTEDMKAAVVISLMVVLSTGLRFVQENRSNRAAEQLKSMVSNTATVMRRDVAEAIAADAQRWYGVTLHPKPTRTIEVPIRELVPGDVVVLSAGDMIPADLRVLSSKDLFINQSAITGESMPVEKFVQPGNPHAHSPIELDNILFMGTNVVSGTAYALVVETGTRTYFGALAQRVTATDRAPTAFQTGVNQVSWVLIRFMMVMTPIVLLINGFTKGDWMEAALFTLSVAVGLTPEMLPMIVTATLAKGAMIMSRKKVVVKSLDAIHNFGAMNILCTDKTGTLTQDKVFLEQHADLFGEDSDEVMEYAYLNSYYQTGLKNLLDVAVLEHGEIHQELKVTRNFRKVDEIPFDFHRRRMSVVVSERENHHLLICKGAVEEVLAACSYIKHGDQIEKMDAERLSMIRTVTNELNNDGMRVIAVAVRKFEPLPVTDDSDHVAQLTQLIKGSNGLRETYGIADESDLMLVGYIAFLDPPKETAAPALKALKEHGIDVKILTGDNELVTAKVCRVVGLPVNTPVLGEEIEAMDDATLARTVEANTVFARLTPAHKERIVRVLRNQGHVVGFLGDGINDAAALRAADIGISVDSAADIAKEAADIILLEKSLLVLEQGVIEGRRTFVNMLKYIKMTASSNFGNVFSVLIASAFLPFLPMLPLHLLVQNLFYDISQVAIPFDNVDKELLEQPQRWKPELLSHFMIFFGPISSIFDISTYCLLWFVFGFNTLDQQTLFQSGWFIEGLLSQTLIVHMIRTRKIPFIQSFPAWPLLGMTVLVMVMGALLPMSPLAHLVKLQALPLNYFPWLVGMLLGYMILTQTMKGIFARRYGWQ